MEQKDYLLREIEKIGAIISAIRQRLFGGDNQNLAITIEKQVEDMKGMLLYETSFDLDKFLILNTIDSNEYITSLKGYSIENIEILAECMYQIGFSDTSSNSKIYMERALQLYELCSLESKTYSLQRESNIAALKDAL